MEPTDESVERRLLVLAPIGKDAELIEATLRRDAITCVACPDVECLSNELERGAAAILVAEEALAMQNERLGGTIRQQPAWSDFPVLLLTRPGADSASVKWALSVLGGNVTLLERPVRVTSLTSTVRSAVRARERQYQLRAQLRERDQADRRKDEFLATLAHELRNPLAPIRNSLSLLRLTGAGESNARIWEMMDRQVNHMVRLVDDLMEVSRITQGKIELCKDSVELSAVVAAAIELSQPACEAQNHRVTVMLPQEPLVVDGDSMRLAQVFSNLINNAAKYTNAGGNIGISARREDDRAVIAIIDTGIGISAEMLPRIFDMFVQADVSTSRARSGLGIGLTLVHGLVEMHGGTVTAHSAGIGRGSEFVVRLPLSTKDASRTDRTIALQEINGLPRVLVVDDNHDAADSLGAVLRLLGADVRVTEDGRTALNMVDAFHPAAVFLDLGMPGMDGYETAKRIRATPEGRTTMLIALTGWGQEKDRLQSERAGFNCHLVKPADIDALQGVLASLDKQAQSFPVSG